MGFLEAQKGQPQKVPVAGGWNRWGNAVTPGKGSAAGWPKHYQQVRQSDAEPWRRTPVKVVRCARRSTSVSRSVLLVYFYNGIPCTEYYCPYCAYCS